MKIYYNQKLKEYSKTLRKKSTLAEVLLWNQLKGRKIRDLQFMRQKPIDIYIVDFYCSKLKLIIEIDGASHIDFEKDKIREDKLLSLGFNVIHYSDINIKNDLDGVLETLINWIDGHLMNRQPPAKATPFVKGELIRFWELD